MSSDNFIWVWKFPDGYRVTWVEQAPDNLYIHKWESLKDFKRCVKEYFEYSKLYETKEEALNAVESIEKDFYINDDYCVGIEYGVIEYEFDFKI